MVWLCPDHNEENEESRRFPNVVIFWIQMGGQNVGWSSQLKKGDVATPQNQANGHDFDHYLTKEILLHD